MATKKLKDGGPCAENETYINGRCVKMNFFNNPAGIGAIGAGLVGIGAAIKKRRANKKEAKADAMQLMKDMKSVSSKAKMKVGGSVGTKKPKMAMGGTKKAMYGASMKPAMMKKGGAKKYGSGGPTGPGDGMETKKATTPTTDNNYKQASTVGKPTGPQVLGSGTPKPIQKVYTTKKTNGKSIKVPTTGSNKGMIAPKKMGGATKKK